MTVCKLADMYDNLADSGNLDAAKRPKTVARVRKYLDALRPTVTAESRAAFDRVQNRLAETEKQLAKT